MGMKNYIFDLNLQAVKYICKACEHTWKGYSHSFARGHLVLTKASRFIFVADDIWYGFPPSTEFDIEMLLEDKGWISINKCPICHSVRIKEPDYDKTQIVKVECKELDSEDFEFVSGRWNINTKVALQKGLDMS